MFIDVEKLLAGHVAAAEDRCRSFQVEARDMKRTVTMSQHSLFEGTAAANWWWTEVGSTCANVISSSTTDF